MAVRFYHVARLWVDDKQGPVIFFSNNDGVLSTRMPLDTSIGKVSVRHCLCHVLHIALNKFEGTLLVNGAQHVFNIFQAQANISKHGNAEKV